MAKFRAKARAVELLGKGQIADLPTAITELWKNGYDAYAKNLECRLFLDSYKDNTSPIFLLADDGFGMSEEDILSKWFVLGTDSKARNNVIKSDFGLERRTPMGEKGIGRLSVSYLGSQMLMITKKENKHANAFLMDWRVLDNYDFFLEDLNIPLFSFKTEDEFLKQLSLAQKEFSLNLSDELWDEQTKLRDEIKDDLQKMETPRFLIDDYISKFCTEEYHGTSFLTFTPQEQLLELSDIDRDRNNDSANYLKSSLSGLHNDLRDSRKDFEVKFFIHNGSGKHDLVSEFFTRDEMFNVDHWIKGEFDKNGLFSGEIKIFNKIEKYSFRPNRPPGKTPYGPFNLALGAPEGERTSSILNEEEYRNLDNKLESFGGLYIYRDDFRVLPYGRTESDFLEFEKRRSLSAGTYFFSHRKMIGYIDLKRERNPLLKDKAGREGFIKNRAYHEFREDLIEFFVEIAKKYMRTGKDDKFGTYRESQINEIKEKHKKQLAAAKRKNKKTKKAFLDNLKENESVIESLNDEIRTLTEELNSVTNKIEIDYNLYNKLLEELDSKRDCLKTLKIQKPIGIIITGRQDITYTAYQNRFHNATHQIKQCFEIVEKTRERINVENLKLEYNEKHRSHINYIERQFANYQQITNDSFQRVKDLFIEEKESQKVFFREQSESLGVLPHDSNEQIASKLKNLDLLMDEQKSIMETTFQGFVSHVSNLQIDVDDDFLRGWYEQQNEELNKKLSDYEELAQVGISIEIIDHQFNMMYAQMNDAVKDLGRFKSENGDLEYSLKQLKNAFQHLELNYKLLRPIYKTSRRTREVILGKEINTYLHSFFQKEFERYNISLSVNDDFLQYEFFTFDSIIKPVFINLINNANYWLISSEKRELRIEYIDDKILIMNSGARIDDTQLESIFTLFYSRKKNGRGIGLYLSRKHMNSIGYDLTATNDPKYNKLNGACFVISKTNKIKNHE